VTYEQAGQACHLCGKQATAIIHHNVEGEINVCGACHVEASDAGEIENIPTKLL
jgi:ribosome-binding protein aMBF1 (putative translation factor)